MQDIKEIDFFQRINLYKKEPMLVIPLSFMQNKTIIKEIITKLGLEDSEAINEEENGGVYTILVNGNNIF